MGLRTDADPTCNTSDSGTLKKNPDEYTLRSPAQRSALQFSPFTDLENDSTDCHHKGRFRRVMTEVSGLNTPPALATLRELSQTTSCDSNRDSMTTVPSLPSGPSTHSTNTSSPSEDLTKAADIQTHDVILNIEENVNGTALDTLHSSLNATKPIVADSKEEKDTGSANLQDMSTTAGRVFNPEFNIDRTGSENKKGESSAVHSPKNISHLHSFEKDEVDQLRNPSKKGSLKRLLSLKRAGHDRTPSRKGSLRELFRKTSKNIKGNALKVPKPGPCGVDRKKSSEEKNHIQVKAERIDITTTKRRFSLERPGARNSQVHEAVLIQSDGSSSEPSSPSYYKSQQVNYTYSKNAYCPETTADIQSAQLDLNVMPNEELTKCTLDVEQYLDRLV